MKFATAIIFSLFFALGNSQISSNVLSNDCFYFIPKERAPFDPSQPSHEIEIHLSNDPYVYSISDGMVVRILKISWEKYVIIVRSENLFFVYSDINIIPEDIAEKMKINEGEKIGILKKEDNEDDYYNFGFQVFDKTTLDFIDPQNFTKCQKVVR